MQNTNRPTGMFGFTLVWLGQIISVLATNMTAFAFTIWVFEETGSATALGFLTYAIWVIVRLKELNRHDRQ